jgi:hypothetical protein
LINNNLSNPAGLARINAICEHPFYQQAEYGAAWFFPGRSSAPQVNYVYPLDLWDERDAALYWFESFGFDMYNLVIEDDIPYLVLAST